jgi:hypothetical protein
LPKTVYFNEFADSNELVILNNNKTIELGKTTIPGGVIKGDHLKTWLQKKIELREKQSYLTGIYLGWDASTVSETPSYTMTLPKNRLPVDAKSILVLSLADSSDNEEEKEEQSKTGQPIDFTIELIDSSGETATLPLSTDAFLQPAIKVPLMVNRFLDPLNPSESVFQTFELPFKEFIAANPRFDPTSLQTIRLLFDKTPSGLIIINYISIRSQDSQDTR